MALKLVRISVSSPDFTSGQKVQFTIYDKNGHSIYNGLGQEWGNTTGVYFIEGNLNFTTQGKETYLAIAEEINGIWRSHVSVNKNSNFIVD